MKFLCLLLVTALSVLSFNAQAATRCVNPAGAVVGYADTAASCPAGSSFKGEIAPMPAAAASDVKSAQAQAARDQKSVDALEAKRLKDERADAKARLAAQKKNASQAKSCKTAELALKRAKDRYDDAPSASAKQPKAKKNSKTQTHTVIRDSDTKAGKAKKKAQHALEAAQGKRDLACG
jgi:hypothetical protein